MGGGRCGEREAERTHLQVEVDEPGERVLVHGVDVGHVADAEEENRRVRRHRLVAVTHVVDLHFRH